MILINNEAAKVFKQRTGMDVIPLMPYKRLSKPVFAHADMLICILDRTLFSYEDYIDSNPHIFEYARKKGYTVIGCKPPISPKYPHDIGLNALVIGKRIFCRCDSIAKEVKEYAQKNGYELINVRQGYAACTTLVLDEQHAVTADPQIRSALEKVGIRVLFIKEEKIKLPGYDKGFIGGATFVENKRVYFFGDAKMLSDYGSIHLLLNSLEMEEISISSGDVYDFGGAKLI